MKMSASRHFKMLFEQYMVKDKESWAIRGLIVRGFELRLIDEAESGSELPHMDRAATARVELFGEGRKSWGVGSVAADRLRRRSLQGNNRRGNGLRRTLALQRLDERMNRDWAYGSKAVASCRQGPP